MPELQFQITADVKGAQDGKRAIDELAQTARRAETESAQAEGLSLGRKRQLRDAIKGLAFEFPILGRVASLALNPISAAVTLAIAGFSAFKKVLDDISRSGHIEGWKQGTAALEAQEKAVADLIVSANAYERSLTRIANATQSVTDRAKQALEAIRAQARAQTELTDAEEAAEMARIDAAEQLGEITPTRAIQQRLETQRRFTGRREAIRIEEEQAGFAARRAEIGALGAERRDVAGAIGAQTARVAELERQGVSPAALALRLKEVEENLARARAAGPGAAGVVGQLEQQRRALVGIGPGRAEEFRAAQEELAELQRREKQLVERERAVRADLDAGVRQSLIQEGLRRPTLAARAVAREAGPLAEQAQGIAGRAFELNQTALAQEGQQLGETITEAVAVAIREAGAPVTDAMVAAVTRELSRLAKEFDEKLRGNRGSN